MARRQRVLRVDDLGRLSVPLRTVLPFVSVPGAGAGKGLDSAQLAARLKPRPQQASLFDHAMA